jgi:hypothetical protein
VRKGIAFRKKGGYTTTSSTHVSHSGSTTGTCRSVENEGSTNYPPIEIDIIERIGNVGNWRVLYVAGQGQASIVGRRGQIGKLDHARNKGDNNNRGCNHQRGKGGQGGLSKLHFGMEEKVIGLSGSG